MSEDGCKNDCVLPLRFPRRPGENPPAAHGIGCACCTPETRISSDNRPALPHFNYRIGTYGTIREWLFHQINQTPTLQHWTHRTPDDPAIALLEGASILGDILTFYQETYANEAFLRTAQWRESISDLVRLLGYRLSPAIGGNATFAFEIKKNEPVIIPAGFSVKATLAQRPTPAEFETQKEITAYPWLSRFTLFRPLIQEEIAPSTTEFYISFPEQRLTYVELKPGDRLMMGELLGKVSDPSGPSFGATVPILELISFVAARILDSYQKALVDANTAREAAEGSLNADTVLIEKANAAADMAASNASMQAVNESLKRLYVESGKAVDDTATFKTANDVAIGSARDMVRLFRDTARDRSLASGVGDTDFKAVITVADREMRVVDTAASAANTAVRSSDAEAPGVRTFIGEALLGSGTVGAAALTATNSEAASKIADRVAREAAETAVQLAAIAQSSAAEGAADRVEASRLAREANRLAGTAVTEAGQVKPAIDTAKFETGVAFGFALAAIPLDSITNGVATTALFVANDAADTAVRQANESQDAADKVKAETQQVVDTLSVSTTAAAAKSIEDRDIAVRAIGDANVKAGRAHTAAETMAKDRADLIATINDAIKKAKALKLSAEKSVDAIVDLIKAINGVDSATLRESVLSGGASPEDASSPARLKNAEVVIVDSVREQHGQKIFKIKGALKRRSTISQLTAFKLGRSFHHFGYNGSPTTSKVKEPIVSKATTQTVDGKTTTTLTNPPIPETAIAFSRFLAARTTSDDTAIRLPNNVGATRIVEPSLGKLEFPLDAEVDNLSAGMTLIVTATLFGSPNTGKHAEFTFVRTITEIKPAVQTWGLASGGTSMVTLDNPLSVYTDAVRYRIADIREFQLHEAVSPMLTINRALEETTVPQGNTLNFYGTGDQVTTLNSRRIMLEKPGEKPRIVTVTQVPSLFPMNTYNIPILRRITVSEQIPYADFPNEDPVTTVYGNLVDADEGKTLPEAALGSGNATQVFQNFKIPKAPLTYHLVREHTPSETPEIDIYVDGRQWTKVDSFFGHGAQEPVYIVREDAAGNSWVQFGDGKTGARLTNGINNVTAIFRIGAGAYGPLKADTKVQAAATLKNLDKIQMPMAVSGGSEPEDGENARNAAPGKVQSLGRIVSLKDFEAEAAAIPGVSRAAAAWQLVENTPAVVVTVLMETGRSAEIRAVGDILRGYNTSRGAGRFSVQVVAGKRKYVTVSIQYALKPGFRADLVEPAIRMALGVHFGLAGGEEVQAGLFSLRQRRFGEREYASSIEGVTQNVEGVLWVRTVAFEALTDESAIAYVDDPETLPLPLTTVLAPIVPCGTGFLLSLYAKHLLLTTVTAEGR